MDAILNSLGALLLNAVPTFLLVLFLFFYLKATFFKPLEEVIKKRQDATVGARKIADEAFARAKEKMAQYDEAIRNARTEVYKEQEQIRQQFRAEQAAAVADARAKAEAMIRVAREQLAADTATAKTTLQAESDRLADEIVRSLFARRAA